MLTVSDRIGLHLFDLILFQIGEDPMELHVFRIQVVPWSFFLISTVPWSFYNCTQTRVSIYLQTIFFFFLLERGE